MTVDKAPAPLVLELGCGKGEYTLGLAKRFPEKNFIGVDIKGARLWRGAKTALEQNYLNVVFLRT
ncbi:MAG: methyltransferase domain-containing protein, partial [Moorea sp. SIO2B7]|nr:methyltransferase domain-containing protein [Moorena sp. SIO2B7]